MYHRAAMQLPPLLSERPRPVQVVLAVVVPVVYGAITGIFFGISEAVYLVLAIAGLLGRSAPASSIVGLAPARCVACWPARCSAARS
jgi:hypothetical protein